MDLKKILLIILLIIAVFYSFILVFMYLYQNKLMYHPEHDSTLTPERISLKNYQSLFITSSDGTKVNLWVHDAQDNKPTILFFHGNTGNLSRWRNRFQWFADNGFGVIALHYRGYGASDNIQPQKDGILQDVDALMKFTLTDKKLTEKELIAYGVSLGTGIATYVAHHMPDIAAVILESPYSSTLEIAQDMYPYLPVTLLYTNNFDNMGYISEITAPIFIYHGNNDDVIPIQYGKKLFNLAKQNDKSQFIELNNIKHAIDIFDTQIDQQILAFLQSVQDK